MKIVFITQSAPFGKKESYINTEMQEIANDPNKRKSRISTLVRSAASVAYETTTIIGVARIDSKGISRM
jgi:hypothetical protein